MARKNPRTPDITSAKICSWYVRVSAKMQVENGGSIEAQMGMIGRAIDKIDTSFQQQDWRSLNGTAYNQAGGTG